VTDQMTLVRAVRAARRGRDAADEKLRDTIRAAHAVGVSLREIAGAAGVSHEQVRRILRADP
jgi:DNA invertase Pin-like site-specific DNA recombinase